MAEEEKIFSTRDIYLASTLITLRFPLIGTDMQYEGLKQRPIGYFKFIETPELADTRSQYNQGLIQVEPRQYMNNLQSLKADVMNYTFNPNSDYNKENTI